MDKAYTRYWSRETSLEAVWTWYFGYSPLSSVVQLLCHSFYSSLIQFMHQQFRSKDPLRCCVRRQTTYSFLVYGAKCLATKNRLIYLLQISAGWMWLLKRKFVCIILLVTQGKSIWSDTVALWMSQLLKSFLTWSTQVNSAASPQNSAMGSDLISTKSAKANTECQSLFCVLCVPC